MDILGTIKDIGFILAAVLVGFFVLKGTVKFVIKLVIFLALAALVVTNFLL